jgi:hypothetical protein
MRGEQLDATLAHEGGHTADAKAFFATVKYDPATNDLTFDASKSLTSYQTEMNAYRVTAAVAKWRGVTINMGPYSFGPNTQPPRIEAITNQLLADPRMGYSVTPTSQGPTQTGW